MLKLAIPTLLICGSVATLAQVELLDLPDARAARLFQTHCAACHTGDSLTPLPFEDIVALRNYRSEKNESVRDLIANKRMPRRSGRVPPLADADRAFLVQYLE